MNKKLPRIRIEFDAADISFGFQCGDRVLAIEWPNFDPRIVTATGQKLTVDPIEVHRPAPLLVFLKDFQSSRGSWIPDGYISLIIGTR